MDKQNLKPGENKVTYPSDGVKLSALLYLPNDYKEGEKLPAIAITRPASGVKEQTAGLYAKKFSEQGFIAIAFDPKGYGDSEGKPQVEDPFSIISDTKNTVTYVQSLREVDPNNVFNAGICMGSGYATAAASEDERIKGTAMISPYLTSHIDYPKAYGGIFITKLMVTLFFRPLSFLLGLVGLNAYVPPVPLKKWMKLMPAIPVQREMPKYYGQNVPGTCPNWKNKINMHGARNFIFNYNPFDYIPKYKKKFFFMAYADGGYSVELLQKFYDEIKAEDKELFICRNAGHFDLYYKPEFVETIVERAASLFKKHVERN